MNLEDISNQIKVCEKCILSKERTRAVPGTGNPNSKVVFIGEAPGYYEDQEGIPFVGRAGKLLTKTLNELKINREDVFITNIAKCRPPDNRRPTREETTACTPYLNLQIDVLTPKYIVPLGATSGEFIFKKYGVPWTAMMKENGIIKKVSTIFGELRILPVIHPAAVLRNPHRTEMFVNALKKLI
ncbi:MAG: uracil-DNA glycosylase [Candidatus Altiarchaeota archaeon]|nr:uracil-DNA glycosylase [Candidatus Altiarchaeota archaeon]